MHCRNFRKNVCRAHLATLLHQTGVDSWHRPNFTHICSPIVPTNFELSFISARIAHFAIRGESPAQLFWSRLCNWADVFLTSLNDWHALDVNSRIFSVRWLERPVSLSRNRPMLTVCSLEFQAKPLFPGKKTLWWGSVNVSIGTKRSVYRTSGPRNRIQNGCIYDWHPAPTAAAWGHKHLCPINWLKCVRIFYSNTRLKYLVLLHFHHCIHSSLHRLNLSLDNPLIANPDKETYRSETPDSRQTQNLTAITKRWLQPRTFPAIFCAHCSGEGTPRNRTTSCVCCEVVCTAGTQLEGRSLIINDGSWAEEGYLLDKVGTKWIRKGS